MKMEAVLEELKNGKVKKMILDTDTYNEVDDQFALAYAMFKTDKVDLLSVNAAPFYYPKLNQKSTSPADGMENSYKEILKIMKLADPGRNIPAYRGSDRFLTSKDEYVQSDACDNIIRTVQESDETVYIVAIGAITNVASALIKCPEIAEKAVLIWLGGNAHGYENTEEFNMVQDIIASQVVYDSGMAIVQMTCLGVCTEFITTIPELEYYLAGKNELCDYLLDIVRHYTNDPYAWSKVIWDVTAVGVLTMPEIYSMKIMPRPIIGEMCSYSYDDSRAPYIYISRVLRDPLYGDLFRKLSER